jgi:hypothetical protein
MPAAIPMISTLHPDAPIHWAEPRGQARVPIAYPAEPHGKPPMGQEARNHSQSAHPPTAIVHHRHTDQVRAAYMIRP